jgi:uncharacterized membrane protein YgcG
MPGGDDAFAQREVDEMTRAARDAEERCGLRFSVCVGPSDGDPAAYAERLLRSLGEDAPRSVLIQVDPGSRLVEIVTGREAAARLADRACRLAIQSMTPLLRDGDVVAGVVTGLRVLCDAVFWQAASEPPSVHRA